MLVAILWTRIPFKLTFLLLSLSNLFPEYIAAVEKEKNPFLYKTVFGLFLHDRGPLSDRHENGVDPNWELQFNPPQLRVWRWIGSPNPMIGITPNFKGDTGVLYLGVNYGGRCKCCPARRTVTQR